MRNLFFTFLFLSFFALSADAQASQGSELIGTIPPAWTKMRWIHSPPLSLEGLKGKVVLIRWWTEDCPFCEASAPALREFYSTYQKQGLAVIGMYHPKPQPRLVTKKQALGFAKTKGFKFPIALDNDWENLDNIWLDKVGKAYTSVSFLIDKKGLIRYIHPGGEFHADGSGDHAVCRKDYLELKKMIEQLLRE